MTNDNITVHGTVASGFEGVRDAYAAVLAEDTTEPGSQLAVRLHGRTVVDLWAGNGIEADSLPAVYSSTKGAAHLVVALLVQEPGAPPRSPAAQSPQEPRCCCTPGLRPGPRCSIAEGLGFLPLGLRSGATEA
ncbi:hypothetical protein [Streptomyces sp. 061-3]|uniref:hypothetical protein n=1 Tax=Streptomyces sp. 061-3 TaxID=2789268 RepID=UPI00398036B2